jgi:protease PrsW
LYVAQGYAESGVPPYGLQLGGRYALFGLGGHAMSTGIFGAFLGIAIQTHRRWIRILAPIAGLVLAIAAHMVNNALPLLAALAAISAGEPPAVSDPPDIGFLDAFVSSSLLELTIFLPFLLITALALWRSCARERRVIREELAGEVGRAVSAGEYEEIVGDRVLRTRRINPMRPRASAALVNAQHELAFRKRRVRDKGQDLDRDSLAAAWRDEIWRLRGGWIAGFDRIPC